MIIRPQIKKFLFIGRTLCALFVFTLLFAPHTTHALELRYPDTIPGFTSPTGAPANPNTVFTSGTINFGDLFQFLFTLALWMIGLFAFGSLLIFGFMYETSAANPQKKLLALQRFRGTLLGVLMLLGFTIILRAINPELATLDNLTFNVCINSAGTNVCPTITTPNISPKLTYIINKYTDPTCCGQNGVTLGTNKATEQQRYYSAFNLTPGIALCSQTTDCHPKDPGHNTIEFFQEDLQYVLDNAKAAGINPVFAVAVWRAGTIESGGNNSFGCITPNQTDVSQPISFLDSFNCFTASVKNNSGDFVKWISAYCDPTHTDKLICNKRRIFMTWLEAFYDNNAGLGGSAFGLLGASENGASTAPPNNTPIENAEFGGSPTGAVGAGTTGPAGAGGGGCSDINVCTAKDATRISLSQFPSSFLADCKTPSCKLTTRIIPHIYDQRLVTIPEAPDHPEWANCSVKNPADIACGPTSLAMIAESFNGEDRNPDGSPRDQTANNLTRFFLANKLMDCVNNTSDPAVVDYSLMSTEPDKTFQVRVEGYHDEESLDKNTRFTSLERYWQAHGNPILTGVWWGGFVGGAKHYVAVAGISDANVWVAEPLLAYPGSTDLGQQVILKIPKATFINSYYLGVYWEISPVPQ